MLDFSYHQSHYKLTSIDLSGQKHAITPQQINFTRKLEEDDAAAMFIIPEKRQKTLLTFSLDSLIVTE